MSNGRKMVVVVREDRADRKVYPVFEADIVDYFTGLPRDAAASLLQALHRARPELAGPDYRSALVDYVEALERVSEAFDLVQPRIALARKHAAVLVDLHEDIAARSTQIAAAKTTPQRRWWCGWIARSGAPEAPRDPAVLGLWESGALLDNHGDVALTFVAWIEAETAEAAWAHVTAAYLPNNETPICRFCEERNEPPQGDRFKLTTPEL